MPKVRIARLKARLSYYLRRVRKGERFTVLYRDTPVAELVPTRPRKLEIRPPLPGALPLCKIPIPKEPFDPGFDSLKILIEDRERR